MSTRKRMFNTAEEHVKLLLSEISDVKIENDRLNTKLRHANDKISRLTGDVNFLDDKIDELKNSIEDLRHVIKFRDETIQKMKLDMEENYQRVDFDSDAEEDEAEDD